MMAVGKAALELIKETISASRPDIVMVDSTTTTYGRSSPTLVLNNEHMDLDIFCSDCGSYILSWHCGKRQAIEIEIADPEFITKAMKIVDVWETFTKAKANARQITNA